MNCPKCGYEQEERLDCRKCGIVFSKYLAMQAEASASTPGPGPAVENGSSGEMLELRQNVRDLSRRLLEVEFERVERGQLRNELKGLDKKSQAGFEQLTARLEELERLLSTPQAPPPIPDGERLAEVQREILEVNVDPIARRLAEAEEKLQRWESELGTRELFVGRTDTSVQALVEPLAARLNAVEHKLQLLVSELATSRDSVTTEILGRFEARLTDLEGRVGSLAAALPGQEMATGYQDLQTRVGTITDELSGVKASADKFFVLQEDVSDSRAEIGAIRAKVANLEGDLERLQVPVTEPPISERLEADIRTIREGMQEIRAFLAKLAARV